MFLEHQISMLGIISVGTCDSSRNIGEHNRLI